MVVGNERNAGERARAAKKEAGAPSRKPKLLEFGANCEECKGRQLRALDSVFHFQRPWEDNFRFELQAVLGEASVFTRWYGLRELGRWFVLGDILDFRTLIDAERMIPFNPPDHRLIWARSMLQTTDALRLSMSNPEDLHKVLYLAQRMRKVLSGECVEVEEAFDAVELVVDRLEVSKVEEGGKDTAPEGETELPGHWVPASMLVDPDNKRIDSPAKVKRFCDKHGVPHRPGTTSKEKPHSRRRDVHLGSWKETQAKLEEERAKLQDAADKLTENRSQFEKWRRQDAEGT